MQVPLCRGRLSLDLLITLSVGLLWIPACRQPGPAGGISRPNIILVMADDLGWGDVGFNGHPDVKTPNLDRLAASGLTFNRFYAAAPVCSPTRASVLTGRHPLRQGIFSANSGHLRPEEITLAEILQTEGYRTGHFGKWHLGTLTVRIHDSNRGRPGDSTNFSLPTMNGFDSYFSTEAKVPTYDPMLKPAEFDTARGESLRYGWAPIEDAENGLVYGTHYWTGPDTPETDNLRGDDSQIIMDRALSFIEKAVRDHRPFLAVIWLHAPHLPVVSDATRRDAYRDFNHVQQLYFGTITALDEQMGRLWDTLGSLHAVGNTMLWFTSDNGPERDTPGSAGPFRERKRSLYEGGVRVPAFLVWPRRVEAGRSTDFPAVTSDYLPTILDTLEIPYPAKRPIDGISLVDLLSGTESERPRAIGFHFRQQMSWVTDQYKLISRDEGDTFELYDLKRDEGEQFNIAGEHPELVSVMKSELLDWAESCTRSQEGLDY